MLFFGRFPMTVATVGLLLATLLSSAWCFQPSRLTTRAFQRVPTLFAEPRSVSEYSSVEEEAEVEIEEEDLPTAEEAADEAVSSAPAVDDDSFVFIPKAVESQPAPTRNSSPKPKPQYAALAPGTVVHIKVGDVSLARKAWKKRRRSGSPLLVPCSVLNVDRQSTVRWNLIYLLEKFGKSAGGHGIRISLADLAQRHRTHLKSSLTNHAATMGYETTRELVEGLINKKAQETYGVKLSYEDSEDGEESVLYLEAPLSRFRAQKRANESAMLQIAEQEQVEDTLQHTGIVRNRRQETTDDGNLYKLQPLSAALRVDQEAVNTGLIQNGSMHAAVVFTYDAQGDAGSPLLTLSLNPARNQVRDRLKISANDSKYQPILNPKYMLKELKVGDGPVEGKVVRLIKGGALLDCGVGRRVNSKSTPDAIRVLGFLRFQDAVAPAGVKEQYQFTDMNEIEDEIADEDWEDIISLDDLDFGDTQEEEFLEEETDGTVEETTADEDVSIAEEFANSEDITHLYKMDDSGGLSYTDPETGETKVVVDADDTADDFEEEDDDNTDDDAISVTPGSQEVTKLSRSAFVPSTSLQTKKLHVGERVEVFVKSVAKQSSQLMLTMNPSIQGMKAKDLKKETDISKKESRLAKQLGGYRAIRELVGQECDGVVKATSNTGDWFYVQPDMENLPVGVSTVDSKVEASIAKGDAVRIQLEGIDEARGQLAMRIIKKL